MKKHKDLYTRNLFEKESNLQIIRLTKDDVLYRSDNVELFSEQVIKHEILYPNIELWLKAKVLPGIKDNSRVAYLGLNNNRPVVSAILKQGVKSKICHLHIDQREQNQHIGDLFFLMMVLDAKRNASEVHFTLPESLWLEKKEFFKSFGFHNAMKASNQYRHGEDELRCSTALEEVWGNAIGKLPNIISSLTKTTDNIFSGILMSIKPEHIQKIQNGEKLIEIRKRFNEKWLGCRMTIYSSTPDQAIYGYAIINDIKKDSPENIWSRYGKDIGIERNIFDEYTKSCEKIYAIFLKDFEPYCNPVYMSQIGGLLHFQDLKPPQSYLSLETNKGWAKAVSVAELLHKRFWVCQTHV